MKKLIWTTLVAVVSAAAAGLAIRGLRFGWTRILKEEPPARPWWARKLVGNPLSRGVRGHAAGTAAPHAAS